MRTPFESNDFVAIIDDDGDHFAFRRSSITGAWMDVNDSGRLRIRADGELYRLRLVSREYVRAAIDLIMRGRVNYISKPAIEVLYEQELKTTYKEAK